MTRIVKKPEERRKELINAALELFYTNGYASTSVESIIKKTGIAKGTFYYYFSSKEEILCAVVENILEEVVKDASSVASIKDMNAMEKLRILFTAQSSNKSEAKRMVETLHSPENRALHEKINVETVLKLSPIVTSIVNQGVEEGKFHLENVLESVQLLLTASQFLTDSGLFKWSQEKYVSLANATGCMIERTLGAEKGSFDFLTQSIIKSETGGNDNENNI